MTRTTIILGASSRSLGEHAVLHNRMGRWTEAPARLALFGPVLLFVLGCVASSPGEENPGTKPTTPLSEKLPATERRGEPTSIDTRLTELEVEPRIDDLDKFFDRERSTTFDPHGSPGFESYQEALDLQRRGELDGALNLFARSLREDPCLCAAWLRSGSILFDRGKLSYAAYSFGQAIECCPERSELYLLHSAALRRSGEPERALVSIDRGIELSSDSTPLLKEKASVLFELKKPSDALETLESIPNADIDSSVLVPRGEILWHLGRPDSAIEAFEAVDVEDQRYQQAAIHIARIRLQRNELPAALEKVDEILDSDAAAADAWLLRGGINSRLGRSDVAIEDWQRAAELRPDSAAAFRNLAALLFQLERDDEALEWSEASLAIEPTDPDLLYLNGAIHLRLGNVPVARSRLSEASDRGSEEAAALMSDRQLDRHGDGSKAEGAK